MCGGEPERLLYPTSLAGPAVPPGQAPCFGMVWVILDIPLIYSAMSALEHSRLQTDDLKVAVMKFVAPKESEEGIPPEIPPPAASLSQRMTKEDPAGYQYRHLKLVGEQRPGILHQVFELIDNKGITLVH
ncbi:hypothetical protein CYMTET_29646 [Cymbomonas tetramitiformis]|uniref:ACT domain-containing protein n=1 Tax=Cymbomonas tetramitiformis TaxID=36881 RepID=A0AAE0FKF5_9CHLO|nr:hypothetical protein CYMTET_29646 [Cymbomonas tetramitiformis]